MAQVQGIFSTQIFLLVDSDYFCTEIGGNVALKGTRLTLHYMLKWPKSNLFTSK